MYYIRYPLGLRQVEDILHERGIDVCHETIRYWWQHIDEVFVKINGEIYYLWRAVDHEGTILDCSVTKKRDKKQLIKY